jgi:hypothetical protein
MSIPKHIIKAAQHAAGVEADGLMGPRTLAALREYDDECDDFDCANDADRLIVAVAQHAAGLTDKAVRKYLEENDVDAAPPAAGTRRKGGSSMAVWEKHEGPGIYEQDGIDLRDPTLIVPEGGLDTIPNRKTMKEVYGDALKLGESGIRKRLVSLEGLPGRFNKGNGKLHNFHKLAAPHLRLALELCDKFGVVDELYRIGTFNYRHMRHDPNRPLSFHSYGVCVDLNPRENFGWVPKGDEKKIAPFSPGWWKKYPRSLSEVAVLCFKKAGFAWGGDWASFRDPMHFELVR